MRDSFGDRLTRSCQAKMCALEVAGHSPLSQDIFTRGCGKIDLSALGDICYHDFFHFADFVHRPIDMRPPSLQR
jgi:hypothetical protein